MTIELQYACGVNKRAQLRTDLPYFGLCYGINRRIQARQIGSVESPHAACGCEVLSPFMCGCSKSEWEEGCVEGEDFSEKRQATLPSGWTDPLRPLGSPLGVAPSGGAFGAQPIPPPSGDSDGLPDGGMDYYDDDLQDSSLKGLTWRVTSWHSSTDGMPCATVLNPATPPSRSNVDWPTDFCFDAEAWFSGDTTSYKTGQWPETGCCPGDITPVAAPSIEEQLERAERAFELFHYDRNASYTEAYNRKGATWPGTEESLTDAKLLVGAGLWFLLDNLDLAQQAFCLASNWSPEVSSRVTDSLRAYLSPRSFTNDFTGSAMVDRISLVLTLSGPPSDGNTNATGWAWTRRETDGKKQWVTEPWWPGFEMYQKLGVILPVTTTPWVSQISRFVNPPTVLGGLSWEENMIKSSLWVARIILHELMHVFEDPDYPRRGVTSSIGGYLGPESSSIDAWNGSGSHHETSYDPDNEDDDPKFGYEHPCWDECRMAGTMFQYWCERRYSFLRRDGHGMDDTVFAHSTRSMG